MKDNYYRKNNMKFIAILFATIIILPFLNGCESDEDNKMAKAQKCLDKLDDSAVTAAAEAQACEDKINGIVTPQSYIIRCSVQFIVGGITSSKMITAFSSYENAAENAKAAILMNALAQTDVAQAKKTLNYCNLSGSPSLIYIATASLTGTSILLAGGDAGSIAANLAKCDGGGSGGVCDDEAIGTAVIALYPLYCVGDSTSEEVCTEIRSAMLAGNNDPEQVAIALYNLLGH